MGKLSEKTKSIIEAAGWYSGRSVDIDSTVEYLEKKGYEVFDCAKDALKEFGGLTYVYLEDDSEGSFIIAPHEALGDAARLHLKRYEVILGKKLVVIGTAYGDNAIMFMDEVGKVYGFHDDYYIWKLGDSIYDAVNNLCECKELKLIHETTD
ncbi:SUKH-3 domain-containing protein [Lysinibacillus sp. RS5]|uniref:SUKH-3 domain-containing protein n=1 Tax=unclassified Lysinibacillus TaxID=2636778 RepID=UPI0035BE6934